MSDSKIHEFYRQQTSVLRELIQAHYEKEHEKYLPLSYELGRWIVDVHPQLGIEPFWIEDGPRKPAVCFTFSRKPELKAIADRMVELAPDDLAGHLVAGRQPLSYWAPGQTIKALYQRWPLPIRLNSIYWLDKLRFSDGVPDQYEVQHADGRSPELSPKEVGDLGFILDYALGEVAVAQKLKPWVAPLPEADADAITLQQLKDKLDRLH